MKVSEHTLQYDIDVSKAYSCRNLLREITLVADLLQRKTSIVYLILVMRILIYYGYKQIYFSYDLITYRSPEWNDILYIISELTCLIILYNYNIQFIEVGVRDYRRKLKMSRIVGSLINPMKNKQHPYVKHFPTLNIADAKTLYAWYNLRVSIIEIGKKYNIRVQFYTSTFLIVYSILGVVFFL
jgi:hypothetical protein